MSITVDLSISESLSGSMESGDDGVPQAESPEPESAQTVVSLPVSVLPDLSLLQSWAWAAYLDKTPAIVSLLINSAAEMRELNKQYRGKDRATNVLSFPMQSPEEVDICLLGDIVLCAEVISQEAQQQSKTEQSHWAHMVVHGMLHLQGYDHIDDDEARIMEQLEIKILKQIGIDSPYQISPGE
ncbi:MAG: rRNA maturation RNase YbeY [Gammaproteobacteria bacterium]|nr:rRNA maturation RNase YbeY [Gammaproteobacteria bacterium]